MSDMIRNGVHGCTKEEKYTYPSDPVIRERLEWFRDQKLAFMMHFGPYAQMNGIDASWPLSEEDAEEREGVFWESDLDTFRQQYVDLNKSFNPVCVQPEKWAEFAAECGFKYLLFTTKHHDGFCMFDTKQTDYKITDPSCPFHTHKHANLTKAVFDAFRAKGLGIGAYFSKPDWHCPWYWAKGEKRAWGSDRNPTYDPKERPDLWNKFTEFTHAQMTELVEEYGKIDILWLDGGQVKARNGQDIQLERFVEKARKIQPWLLTADRTVGGEYENYITPEQSIPDHVIRVPWESCVTLGKGWSHRYNDEYKSTRAVVKMVIEVVSHGGNLAINVGPQPNGELPAEAQRVLRGLGEWLKVNGEGIYGTRADVGRIGNVMFTQKGGTRYAFLPLNEGEVLPATLRIPVEQKLSCVRALGLDAPLDFTQDAQGITIHLPKELQGTSPYAVAFALM